MKSDLKNLPKGLRLMQDPTLNKGTAFSEAERDALGLRGLVIKSHGSADAYAFEWAIKRGYDAVKNGVLERLARAMDENAGSLEQAARETGGGQSGPLSGPLPGPLAAPGATLSSKA